MRTSSSLVWPQEGSNMSSPVASSRATIRRANKPLLEKRRRARINASLNQLKMLVLETLQKDSARYSKLEKADILEMTVVHLKALRHQQKSVHPHRLVTQYGAGYKECANEIRRYFDTVGCPDVALLTRLENHLSTCVRKVDQVAVDISLSLNHNDPSLAPSIHHQHPLLLVPTNHLFPVQLQSDVTTLRAEGEDRKCVDSDCGADRSLSSLLSYLGVSTARRNPGRQPSRKIEQVLDENENVTGREDGQCLESAKHLYAAAMDRFNAVRSADTVRDLLLKSFDMGNINRVVGPDLESLNESVWRPW